MCKNIRKQYKNNKLKIITLTWNNDFELPDCSYSVSDIQDYIEFIIKKHENAPSFEVVEVVLFQCNLVGSQYQEKPEVLYTFTPNKSYAYLLHVEANNLVFWKTYNTESDEIIITFTDQNGRPLERGNKVNLTLLIHK